MTHLYKRTRKIAELAHDIIGLLRWHDATFTELTDAYALAHDKLFHLIEKEYKIPCPTCRSAPKRKKK